MAGPGADAKDEDDEDGDEAAAAAGATVRAAWTAASAVVISES
jgi:hypothetical protein